MLVAFTGFGGSGKTTAIEHLEALGLGRRVYLGEIVFEEIARRGLRRTPEIENMVRIELRAEYGSSAFADLKASYIVDLIRQGESVLVDAIFNLEEYARLLKCGQSRSVLIDIKASTDTRCKRMAQRTGRGFSIEQLKHRDRVECETLGIDKVFASADFVISNERSLAELRADLDSLWKQI